MIHAGTAAARGAQPDQQAIIEAVKLLHPGRVVELRILNLDGRSGMASGYFDQPALLAQAAVRCNRRAEGLYITLNPVKTSLMGRASNHVLERAKDTTKDGDVLRRAWFPIDLDPARPSGISSSEDEHQAALEQARRVREWLGSEWGWHAPIFADSGNGAHLLYAIDLPNDAASTDLLKRCLGALASRFTTEAVTLDQSVYNAARIWKLYGTVARKGEHLPERPHRRAQIISAPDPVELVTREQLEALAAAPHAPPAGTVAGAARLRVADSGGTAAGTVAGAARLRAAEGGGLAAPATAPAGGPGRVTEDDLLAWLERHEAKVLRTKEEPGRSIYVLERCPFAEHHEPGKACVTLSETSGPGFKCQTDGCQPYHWQDVVALWGDGPARTPDAGPPAGGTGWPEPPDEQVYYGLAGELVNALAPYTEADPLALLVQLLTVFGAAIGGGPHFFAGAGRHEPRLFSVLVGKSAKARKGESWQAIRRLALASGEAPRIQTSLSSGEGLVWLMRDPVVRQRFIEGKRGQQGHYEQVIEDEGEPEKRVLVVAGEFSQILKVMRREGNTLSPILRDAWDQGDLTITTKTMAARASSAYLSVIGHITVEELRAELRSLDAANGFANRFCWFAIRKSKNLPEGEPLTDEVIAPLGARLGEAIRRARQVGLMRRDSQTRETWREMYPSLASEHDGFVGALASRSEAQVLRLSMLYALLDGSPVMTAEHLAAASELWLYATRSLDYLFGGLHRNRLAERIEAILREHGELSRTQLRNEFHRHVAGADMDEALETLKRQDKIEQVERRTGQAGRPGEYWRICAG